MNLINQDVTMSSRELLNLINEVRKEKGEKAVRVNQFHERVADELSDFNYKTFVVENLNNTQSTYFELTEDMCMLVSMRESKKVRRNVLEQLKSKFNSNQMPVPTTLPEALRLAADMAEKIALDAPKVEFVDKFVDVGTTKTIREVAKILGIPEQKLIAMMKEDKIIYKQSGVNLPHAYHEKQGYFEVKTGDTNGFAFTQTRVTTKGMAYLAKRYTSRQMVA